MTFFNIRNVLVVANRLQDFHIVKRFFNHKLSQHHEIIRQTCREFSMTELLPIAGYLDKNSLYPHEPLKKLGQMGFLGMCKSSKYGRKDFDALGMVLAIEELSRGCASTGVIVSIHNCLYVNFLDSFGTDEQKEKYLDEFTKGKIGCFALSEPNAGTNVAELETMAIDDGDSWIINGTKSWVSSAPEGEAIIVFAKTDKGLKHKGITAFIVDKNTPGISLGRKDDLMGIRALSSCSVTFDDVRVSKDSVVGGVGEGFKLAMNQLSVARIGISAQALGIAQAALDCAVVYSTERKAMNVKLADLPEVKSRIAEMALSVESARLMLWKAAAEHDSGNRSPKYPSMAKMICGNCANFVADNCIQIMGGMGLAKEHIAERLYRDARGTKIYGGVVDIQKTIISEQVVKEYVTYKSQNLPL